MKAADLRKSILQAAVQGRLVPQDKNDKPASELFKQIQAKKNELIKEGRIKKEKPMLPITDDEIPYDLPEGWVWCRLCDLGSFSSGKTPDMTNPLFWDNGTVIWVSSKDMKSKYLSDSKMKITELAKENMTIYPAGTLLMVVRSGILKRMLPVCVLTVESTVNQDIKAYSLFDRSRTGRMREPMLTALSERRASQMDSLNEMFFNHKAAEGLTYEDILEDVQKYCTANHADTLSGEADRSGRRGVSHR